MPPWARLSLSVRSCHRCSAAVPAWSRRVMFTESGGGRRGVMTVGAVELSPCSSGPALVACPCAGGTQGDREWAAAAAAAHAVHCSCVMISSHGFWRL